MQIKDRVKKLIRVKASDIKENPFNFRLHNDKQKEAIRGILSEVGVAGAVIAREMEDGTLILIDGHLRRKEFGDQKIPVLVLDVTEDEANLLLASFDPIGSLGVVDKEAFGKLAKKLDTPDNEALANLWSELGAGSKELDPKNLKIENLEDIDDDESLTEDDEDESEEDSTPAIQPSHVVMVQLFLNTTTEPPFREDIKYIQNSLGTKNLTDTVIAGLKAYRIALEKKEQKNNGKGN